jgi:serine/threonine-protein kinase
MSETEQNSPLSVQPGQILDGKFRVDRVLGEGGMGVVVAATHVALGQRVAIKFMLPRALASADNVARFEREARAVVRLRSEHVARVTDVGRLETGAPYIVMEFLEGYDLDRLLEGGALPIDKAIDYLLQACEAIAEAHSLGIVHRDLKPTNLFLTTRVTGKPLIKVLDFGISKSNVGDDLSLTSTSQIMGSPNYMSPEQLRSARNVDARTDIWALGAILYELLTRQVPFVADSVTQLTAMVVTEAPRPILELRPEIPPPLAAAIMKCLEKRRDDRFQSVSEFARAIAPFASPEGALKAGDIASASGEHASLKLFPEPVPSSSPRSSPAASTASAWDRTQLAPNSIRQKRASIAAAVFAILMLAGVGTLVVSKHGVKSVAAPDGTASTQLPTTNAAQTVATTSAAAVTAATIDPPLETTPTASTIAIPHPPIHTKPPSIGTHVTSKQPKPDATGVTTSQPTANVPTATAATSHPPELPNVRN